MTETTHKCPKNGCELRVPHHRLACRAHWYAIPGPYRDAVWQAYRVHGMGSPEHGAAIRAAVGALNREH
jgi:hypothetical protein